MEGDEMDGYRQQKRLLLAQGQEMQRMAEQLADEQVKENLHTLIHTLESEQFFVTVVGEFSRGKSTLMNALLGENILPTAIRPTTAVLTFIHHEDGKTARIHDRQGRCREIPWDRKAFKEFTALRDVDAGEIRCMELGVPLADIPEDIILVDTPGVNDVSEQRMDVTYEYIPVSDAVIFVLSAKQPLTQSEWQFLQDFVAESAIRHFFFVLNFKDAVDARELSEAVADVRRRLSHLMPEEEIRIFPISAKEALAAKEEGDAPRLDASGYTAWFQAFRTFLQGDARHEKKLARYREHLGGLRQMLLEHVSLREQEAQLDRAERIAVGEGLQTEKELVEAAGLRYKRIAATDHIWPSPAAVDEFVQFYKSMPEDVWLHFHCQAGEGRTTEFLAMYDILKNPAVPLQDILYRQCLLGGSYVAHVEPEGSTYWKVPYYAEKAKHIALFYRYVQENEGAGFAVSWSDWLAAPESDDDAAE